MSRSTKTDSRPPRRQFIGELAVGAAALAAAACAPAATAATAASQAPTPSNSPSPPKPAATPSAPTKWDVSWMDRITAKHKAVFDSPQIDEGTALWHALSYLQSVKAVFGGGDSDASVVCVFRHAAVPVIYNDAIWAKYDVGALTSTKDETTKKPVKRNVYYQHVDPTGKPNDDKPTATVKSLSSRGVIFVGCDAATHGFAFRIAEKHKLDANAVYEELKQNLIPGATLMPTGIFATLMAQEAGCSLMRST